MFLSFVLCIVLLVMGDFGGIFVISNKFEWCLVLFEGSN